MEQTAKSPEAAKPASRTMLYAIIVIVLIVVGVGVYYLTRPTTPPPPTGPQVSIDDDGTCPLNDVKCVFNPETINATANGPPVTWTIKGTAPHTVHACVSSVVSADGASQPVACPKGFNSNSDAFTSGTLVSSGTTQYSHVFTQAGTYYYYCSIHTWMHGNVTV